MIARIFIFIYERVSFTFAVALFTTAWSWVASFYGFFFVYATVNFGHDEIIFILTVLVACTGVAIFFHLCHFGLFHRLGCSGFSRSLRIINQNFENKKVFKHYRSMSASELEETNRALSDLPKINLMTAFFYTALVILVLEIVISLRDGDPEKAFFIMVGGLFASLIIGYCTFLITEYFSGPYRMRLQQILFERSITTEVGELLSFRLKSIIMLVLICASMGILTVLLRRSEKPILQIVIFILLSVISAGLLIFLMIHTLNLSLETINRSTRKLAAGETGMFFPPFPDAEFVTFSENYNTAAVEIEEIRTDLEKKIRERTEELRAAYEKLNSAYGQIQADLNLARRIQKRIMPDNLESFPGVSLSVHYYPMTDIGGDIYDIARVGEGCTRFFLADAIGHGIQAALITMIIKGEYEKIKAIDDPSEALRWLNRSFIDLYGALNAFFSCIIVDVDVNEMLLRYASAGHPDQLFLSKGTIETVRHTGRLIGIKNDIEFDSIERRLSHGDILLLYTDGLFEQYNDREETFTEQDIRDVVMKNVGLPVDAMTGVIIERMKEFLGRGDLLAVRDDITLIGIEIAGT